MPQDRLYEIAIEQIKNLKSDLEDFTSGLFTVSRRNDDGSSVDETPSRIANIKRQLENWSRIAAAKDANE